jgi:hypothetical protein
MPRTRLCTLALIAAAACSDPAGTNEPARLEIEGGSMRTLRIGSQEQMKARFVGTPAAAIAWTSSDTSIARINADGLLRLSTTYTACNWVTPGECEVRITATSGSFRADQIITVLPYEATLELNTSQLDLEMGDSTRISARVLLENNVTPWCSVQYSSQDSAIAQVGASGIVVGRDEGRTVVDITTNGPLCPRDAAHVSITSRPPRYVLAVLPGDAVSLAATESQQLIAQVTNWKGVAYAALSVQWSTSNAQWASVNSSGLVRAGQCDQSVPCRVTITARSGRLIATKEIVVL